VGYGGAPIAPALVRAVKAAFPQARVSNGYGMTETASLMTVLPDEEAIEHADSVGYAVPSVDIGVIPFGDDPAVGELVCRGANVTGGYWNRPEATSATIVDGWLHTGDVARIDEDGYTSIVQRKKDMIIVDGYNVYPSEVESVLYAHPAVRLAAVIGVPDPYHGEVVKACIVLKPGAAGTIDEIIASCREGLTEYKVPRLVEIRDTLPMSAVGKILYRVLRDEHASASVPQSS